MKKIFRGLLNILTAPFRLIWKGIIALANLTFLKDFIAEDPEDTPIPDILGKTSVEGLFEHITALRKHLLRAVIILVIACVIAFIYISYIMDWLAVPIGGIDKLKAIEVTEPVGVVMRIAFFSGLVAAIPYITFELLWFIAPGISRKARLIGLFGIPFVLLFFAGGIIFTYSFMLEPALGVLTNFMEIQTELTPNSYFKFVSNFLFWMGVAFNFPFFTFILSAMRILSAKTLKDNWRLAFILLAVLAAVITPTVDPLNMGIVLLPLWTLYGLGILMAYIGQGRRKKE